MSIIRAVNLTKVYDDFTAVDNISFEIEQGEIFGLLGPNGAGKTTTMKLLIGITSKTSGTISVFDREINSTFDSRDYMTIVPQEPLIWETLTLKENIEYMIDIYDLDKTSAMKEMEELLDSLSLSEAKNKLAKNLSGGMKQKLNLLMSILTERPVLILDEPTTGLDPIARKELWSEIIKLKEKGKTIILSTHYMEEADYLCDRIAIMDHGKIVALGTPEELKEKYGGKETITFDLKSGDVLPYLDGLQKKYPNSKFKYLNEEKALFVMTENAFEILSQLVEDLNGEGIKVEKVSVSNSTLDDVFINLTGRKLSNE